MPLNPTAEDLIAAVQASPRAVARHDKSAWLALFTDDAEVHDPVGSRAHIGRDAISRFYDTFIGPNTIAFDVERDLVGGRTVVRDLHIRTTMSTGATVTVPMHLRYDLVEAGAGWRITRLAAHWELPTMIARLLRTGGRGVLAGTILGPQLVRNLGIGGAAGMMSALRGVGGAGKRLTRKLFEAASETDIGRVRGLLGERAVIEAPAGQRLTVEEFTNRARNMRWDKLIAAGRTVSASVTFDGAAGVAFVDFAPRGVRVERVTLFLDA